MSQAQRPQAGARGSGDSGGTPPTGGQPGPKPAGQGKRGLAQRLYTLSFTVPKLLFFSALVVVTITWAFIFGIMIGRGHKPENAVPQLAKILPSPQAATTVAPPPPAEVFKPEELTYHDTLKGKPIASAVPGSTKPTTPRRQTPPAPVTKPVVVAPTAKTKTEQPAARPEPAKSAQPKTTVSTEGVFDYTYQVAAFKDQPPADALRNKLQKAGFTVKVDTLKEGNTTWYRVLAYFKGKPEETRILKDGLAKQGFSRIILRGKIAAR